MSGFAMQSRSARVLRQAPAEPVVLPTLFGEGYGIYKVQGSTFVLSFVVHVVAIALLVVTGRFVAAHGQQIRQQAIGVITDISPYVLPPARSEAGGGGGGGDRDKLVASKGVLPRFSREQLAPPAVVLRNANPKLSAEPTVVVPPEIYLPVQAGTLGDPLSAFVAPLSSGTGSGGGIGSGSGGGVGSGRGPGVGPGWGGGIGGGAYRVGGGVTAPRVIYGPEPEFSDEARKAKYQGTVILWVIVGTDGRVHNVRVHRSLGMGLDEKAITAIKEWRFEPGRKNGVAVAVQVNVEVNFRLY